jgi:hypothetical protein
MVVRKFIRIEKRLILLAEKFAKVISLKNAMINKLL